MIYPHQALRVSRGDAESAERASTDGPPGTPFYEGYLDSSDGLFP